MTYRAEEHLKLLKPFQRATVDYVFRRLLRMRRLYGNFCQTASKTDPRSASNFDPPYVMRGGQRSP
ncbi:hypothetical protein, partial [Mesorhizobium sp. M1403]|uniref:hypothetical protein n=1 Tax=Mesorhizobium sp. M1403 TaxID=2957097 RepID=UPI0033365AB3